MVLKVTLAVTSKVTLAVTLKTTSVATSAALMAASASVSTASIVAMATTEAMVAMGKMVVATMISEYYIVLKDGKKKCKLCDDPDKANVYGSTTLSHNLFKHLKATHNLNLFGGQSKQNV